MTLPEPSASTYDFPFDIIEEDDPPRTRDRDVALSLYDEDPDARDLNWLHPPQIRCPGCACGGPMEGAATTADGMAWQLWCEMCKTMWVSRA